MKNIHFFFLVGEHSGDLHATHLIKSLKTDIPQCHISGVAGPLMRAEGVECLMAMEKFMVMGFSDVIKAFPSLYKQFYLLLDAILKSRPDVVIFVDYPGFNLRLAKALRKAGYKGKLIHYICPSVWAWGKKRVNHMAATLDMLLTIYPFEAPYFNHTKLSVKYIGNPLQDYVVQHQYQDHWRKEFPFNTHPLIALFPGSREGEIKRNLPKQLQAAVLFQKKHPEFAFAISCSNPDLKPMIEKMMVGQQITQAFIVPKKYTYELMRDCHSAVAKSGTVTLELALHQRPTVVVYELSHLNWFIAKFLIRLKMPHYCIVNILSEKRLFPELIEAGFDKENLALQLENIHSGPLREECLKGCQQIQNLFQGNASSNAALAIRDLLL